MRSHIEDMKVQAPSVDAQSTQQDIQKFINALFQPDDCVEIRVIKEYWGKAKGDRPEGFRTYAESHFSLAKDLAEKAPPFLLDWNAQPGVNVYVGVNPRRKVVGEDGTEEAEGGGKKHVAKVVALHADLDGIVPDEAKAKALELGLEMMLVGSGAGTHAYLLLETPMELKGPEDVVRAERLVRRLSVLFGAKIGDQGADHCHDLSRILRVPGLINWPDDKKRSKGRIPTLCHLALTTDKRYSVEELDGLLPQLPDGQDVIGAPTVPMDELTASDDADVEFHGAFDAPAQAGNQPVVLPTQEDVARILNEVAQDDRMQQLASNLKNIIRKHYKGKDKAYWDGQSPRGERARRLIHLAWKFAVGLDVFLAWAREKGSGIENDASYWRTYQRRYLAPRFPEGYGLRGPDGPSDFYLVRDGCLCRRRRDQDGDVIIPLGNFEAKIAEAVVADDGVETTTILEIEGSLAGGRSLPRVSVPVDRFGSLNWVMELAAGKAVLYAGQGTRDHARAAIQILSGEFPERRVYTHTGWRKVGDAWLYLHADGAIGKDGLVAGVEVALPDALKRYQLPTPPDGEELRGAVRASLGLLDGLASDGTAFALFASVWRSVLGTSDHSTFLLGPTGVFKSELAALALQHFGAGLDARHLPASWMSTANSLEGIAFACKDSLLVVDDFAPGGSQIDIARQHKDADRLFRAQGNGQGRQRMKSDSTLRPDKAPRGMILSTGEDAPRGHSVRARLLLVEVAPGEVNVRRLTECQRDSGLYAKAMSGFLRWMAANYETFQKDMPTMLSNLRQKALDDGLHARTPSIIASLELGLMTFLRFAHEVGVLSKEEVRSIWERGRKALLDTAALQAEHQRDADPAERFLNLVSGMLASGRAHLYEVSGLRPANADRFGWRREQRDQEELWKPQGRLVGWVEDESGAIYLEPDAAFAEVQRFATEQGTPLPVAQRTLNKRLKEKGLLARTDDARGKILVRKSVQEHSRKVLALRADVFERLDASA